MSIQYYIYAFFLVLCFTSCQEDSFIMGSDTLIDDPVIVVSKTSLVCFTYAINGEHLLLLKVSHNGITYTADEMGRVFIPLTQVSKTGDLITISDEDRITVYKTGFN